MYPILVASYDSRVPGSFYLFHWNWNDRGDAGASPKEKSHCISGGSWGLFFPPWRCLYGYCAYRRIGKIIPYTLIFALEISIIKLSMS